jgi:branched-chain amino acid transport system permease protein
MSLWYQAHLTLLQTTSIYIILALSFQIVLRSGVFSFASIGFYGIGSYTAANLAKHHVGGLWTMLIVVVASAALGYAMSLPLLRLRGLYLGMVTFAFDEILVVFANNGGSLTGGATGLFGVPAEVTTLQLFVVTALCVLFVSQLERRRLGRSIAVLPIDESLAGSVGLDVNRHRNFIFALSAALGGLAGVLFTFFFTFVTSTSFGFDLIVSGLTMAVVGGVGSWVGAVIGAVLVLWFPVVFTKVGSYSTIVYGILVILIVVFEPRGLFGLAERAGRRLIQLLRGRRVAKEEVWS